MQKQYHDLFCDLQSGKSLVFQGESDLDGNWLNGLLLNQDNQEVARVENGIAIWPCDDPWTEDKLPEFDENLVQFGIDHTTFINLRWREMSKAGDFFPLQMKYLEKITGKIMEIAIGPGGGFAPVILNKNPSANLIFNDIGLWLLQEWQKLQNQTEVNVKLVKDYGFDKLSKEKWPNVSFVRFDFNKPPIKAATLDCVSSLYGLTNVANLQQSVNEIHRLLKPGGLLVMYDGEIAEDCLKQLTEEQKLKIYDFHKGSSFDVNYYEADFRVKNLLAKNGFEILDFSYGRRVENDGSNGDSIPKLFTEMGIKFAFQNFHLVARKI